MKKTISHFNLFLLVLPMFTVSVNANDAQQSGSMTISKSSGYAPVDGIRMFYKIHKPSFLVRRM